MSQFWLRLLLLALSLSGCIKSVGSGSGAKVANGEPDNASHQATIKLNLYLQNNKSSFCTGAVVTDTLVLTAAHCIIDGLVKIVGELDGTAEAVSWEKYPGFDLKVHNGDATDVAFVTFKPGSIAGAVVGQLSPNPAFLNEAVTLVGYGAATFTSDGKYSGQAVRRVGHNTIDSIAATDDQLIGLVPAHVATPSPGEPSEALYGDSGGPLYDQAGLIIGITHTGSFVDGGTFAAYYVNIHSKVAGAYIASHVPGFTPIESDPAH